ncbi:hypothetical protein ACFS7Z_26380 [Pontibacter toksunensis]|uniref:Uncharacterized protein n=1 Tax=Pontibacter toksunensis TaxID=1332631 RepID=A0ABW6C4E6_9BACT
MTKNQFIVFKSVLANGTITKKEAIELIKGDYNKASADSVGHLLSRMVSRRLLIRIEHGTYKVGDSLEARLLAQAPTPEKK